MNELVVIGGSREAQKAAGEFLRAFGGLSEELKQRVRRGQFPCRPIPFPFNRVRDRRLPTPIA